jgi:predicted Zn-dependent protease
LIGSIRERLPEVARGPDATVVAVLDDDLFAQALRARYLFAFRGDGHVALVALKRLAPPAWQFWSRGRVLEARMRKMITKNIGVVAYGLPLSTDPTSVSRQHRHRRISISCASASMASACRRAAR